LFRTRILVRFGDLDPAGIAYYPRLVDFLHVGFEDFLSGHVGRPFPEVLAGGLGFPIVRLEMDFRSPVRHGDPLDLGIGVEHLGRSSLRLRYEGEVAGRAVFVARATVVAVDMTRFRPVRIPEPLRGRFEAARA
jgi:4-hydroxybenzoyl-CoA thioesterase